MNRIILNIFLNLVWVRVSEWVTGLGARFFAYLNPSRLLGFIICQEFFFFGGGGGYTPGISGSTYAMKLKLTPGMALDKRSWLITHLCHLTRVYFTDQQPFLITSATNDWWRHKSTSLIKDTYYGKFQLNYTFRTCETDDHYFHTETLICKSHFGSRKVCLRMCRRFCHQMFLSQNVPKEILFNGTKFHAKLSISFGVI